ncbi:MAG: hypothetical protein SVR94_10525 [Pseudomonadota bacterium]|nr:hypothetical protein [Pseudomonadota bacterium]
MLDLTPLPDPVAPKQRERLESLIDHVLSKASKESISNAPTVMSQFVSTAINHPEARTGNGKIILEVLTDAAKGMPESTYRNVLESILLCATGKASPGLFRFPSEPFDTLSLAHLQQFARVLSPDGYEKLTNELAQAQAAYYEAEKLADQTAAPVVIMPNLEMEVMQ